MFERHVRRMGTALAAVVCAAVIGFAFVPALSAQGQRVPGPPPDRMVDVLIGFRSTPTQADEALVRGAGGSVNFRYRIVPAIAASLPEQAVAALLANPRVAVIEPDGQVFAIGEPDYQGELDWTWGVKRIGAGELHEPDGQHGAAVTVAVIDSGIDYSHPELLPNYAGGATFVSGTTSPMDDNGHGTHAAGTIGAVRNGSGVVGVAPAVRLSALKVLNSSGSGSWSSIIAAVQYAVDQQIRITNNSYGAGSNPGSIVQAAFDNSAAEGVLHIAAAGNSGNCGGNNNSIGWPARFDSVVAVGATSENDVRPCFSSTGPALELAAPGVRIPSTVLNGGYASWSGTSMASPHVAGVAALVKSVNPELSAADIREVLRSTTDRLGSSNQYGHGLVNAVNAVDAAIAWNGSPAPDPDPGNGNDEQPANGVVRVGSITYSSHGGPQSNRHLSVTLAVQDGDGAAVAGASVAVTVTNKNTGVSVNATGTTGSNGSIAFTWNNAPSGCYETGMIGVDANGLEWDGKTPDNEGCK